MAEAHRLIVEHVFGSGAHLDKVMPLLERASGCVG
jgi:hypothetical protein